MDAIDRPRKPASKRAISSGIAIALAIVALIALVPVFLLSWINVETDIRFVVHATLKDGQDTYEGSAVWEMHLLQARSFSHDMVTSVRGEAIHMRGSGEKNFFLLRVPEGGGSSLVYGDYPLLCIPGRPRTNIEIIQNMESMFTGPCAVTERRRPPLIIEIPDLTDPASIRRIPYTFAKGNACEGVCLTELWVERTQDPITTGIMELLPWLQSYRYGMTDVVTGSVPKTGRDGYHTINLMDFTTEFEREKIYE